MKTIKFIYWITIILLSCQYHKFSDKEYHLEKTACGISITDHQYKYVVSVIKDDIIKVNFFTEKDNVEEKSFSVILKQKDKTTFTINEENKKIDLFTSKMCVRIEKNPLRINIYDLKGKALLLNNGFKVSGNKKTISFKLQSVDAFYGMGQKTVPVDRKGQAFLAYNTHVGGYTKQYANMQVNIPYVYSPAGYGVFFDNTWPGYYDLGKTKKNEWNYTAENGIFTYYITVADQLPELLEKYFDLTGYPPIPPKWAFGLLQSKCTYLNDNEVYAIIKKYKDLKLPLDAIILDANWFGGYGEQAPQRMGNFSWLKTNFPDPAGYMKKLKEMGIKTITINEPAINMNSENYNYLSTHGLLVHKKGTNKPYIEYSYWAGKASLLDITNPLAQQWLWQKMKKNVELGLDAFWVDLSEPEMSVKDGMFYLGDERKVHNIYSHLFAMVLWEGFKKDYPNRRLFNITRSGYAGTQRYGAINWSGDASKTFEALKCQIPMLIGASMSGMPHYSSDIGGFTNAFDTISVPWNKYKGPRGFTTPELYTRWFEFGVFSPLLRPHSGEGQAGELFAHGQQTTDITSKYLKLRYKLIPYIYSYAFKTSQTGEMLVNPVFFSYSDTELKSRDDQYLFGKEFLIAPVVQKGKFERTLFLPALKNNFKWVSYWDEKLYEGGKELIVKAPLQEIPVFVKQPSIIPFAEVKNYIDEVPDTMLTLEVYPGGYADFLLYEDDGISNEYKFGNYATTKIETKTKMNTISIIINPIEKKYKEMILKRTWVIHIHLLESFQDIFLNGKKIFENQYNYDKIRKMITLKIHSETSLKNIITVEGVKFSY